MRQAPHIATAIVFAVSLAGCSTVVAPSCPAGLKAVKQEQLIFGRAISTGGEVGDEDWRRFVDEEITPRFSDGLSVIDASGQWKDSTGIVRERSKHLMIVLSGSDDERVRLEAVRSAYRRRFHQDSVLLIETNACAGF